MPGTYISPAETGCYYLNSRYYSPEVGRFVNADSIVDNRGLNTQNLYAYCLNNPVNYLDVTGHFVVEGTVALVSGIGVLLIGVLTILAINETAEVIKTVIESTNNINNVKNQSVYILTDPNDSNKIKYVGRTNNPERRRTEHSKHEVKKQYDMTVVATGLSVSQARVNEQLIISAYTIDLLDNKRREIAVGKVPKFANDAKDIINLYGSVVEDELLNLMGR